MNKRTKKTFVANLTVGERIEDSFVIVEKTLAHKRDGNPYLMVTLGDRSGTIKGMVWDNVTSISADAQVGDFALVGASVSEYRGKVQVVIHSVKPLSDVDVDPGDYLPASTRNVDQMFERLKSVSDSISAEHLRDLLNAMWEDSTLVKGFKRAPAAKKMHHAYLGGLLEHTLSMALLADKIAGHYSGLNRDLLIIGAVVHDIGKIKELSYDRSIDYTDQGRLLSHIVLGLEMVEAKIRSIENFPDHDAAMIKHMIVSHHGAREFGSPEPPKTIEAVLLNYIDEIDSRVNGIREFMADSDPDSTWTAYHRLLERHFFKGDSHV
jgi:3'-5' exoribonuclease